MKLISQAPDTFSYSDLSKLTNNKLSGETLGSLINLIVPYIFYGAGIILLIIIISGGLRLMFSAGDPKKTEMAKKTITSGIIGFIIIFLSYWIVQLIYKILGVEPLFKII